MEVPGSRVFESQMWSQLDIQGMKLSLEAAKQQKYQGGNAQCLM